MLVDRTIPMSARLEVETNGIEGLDKLVLKVVQVAVHDIVKVTTVVHDDKLRLCTVLLASALPLFWVIQGLATARLKIILLHEVVHDNGGSLSRLAKSLWTLNHPTHNCLLKTGHPKEKANHHK